MSNPYRPTPEQDKIPWQLPSSLIRGGNWAWSGARAAASYLKGYVLGIAAGGAGVLAAILAGWCAFPGAFRIGNWLCTQVGWVLPTEGDVVNAYVGRWLLGLIVASSVVWAPMLSAEVASKVAHKKNG